jgi:uncharacterized repeat protein (TIGR03806 family)
MRRIPARRLTAAAVLILGCDAHLSSQIELGPAQPSVDAGRDAGSVGPPAVAQGLDVRPSTPAFLGFPQTAEFAAAGWDTVVAFPHVDFDTPVFLAEAPGTGKLFIAEREGRIWAIDHDPNVSDKTLVLDLSAHTQGFNDSGLMSFAFHPQFGTDGENGSYFYVHYAYSDDPVLGSYTAPAPDPTITQSRLSRFTFDFDSVMAETSSELILIDQRDQNLWHQGGSLFFHPEDGFLYLTLGDEGSAGCPYGNCQIIDQDLFGGVLRIDVDQIGGDVSHPIVRQPATGSTANYYIPNDNPFVGQAALEEFYAIGLRSPHRMTHDAADRITWIGDVGQSSHEELNVLQGGANFQWNVMEGLDFFDEGPLALPLEVIGDWTDPVLELPRSDARAVIGGYVYRGERLPELRGKYIYADFAIGNIWALDYRYEGQVTQVVSNDLLVHTGFQGLDDGITSFGVDSRGELFFVTFGKQSKIQRLTKVSANTSNLPRTLSETALFGDLASVTPQSALVPYAVNTPLWADGAEKRRWAAIPDGQYVAFDEQGPWQFPDGSVFVKHFDLVADERHPDQKKRLETRVLVMGVGQQLYGATYKWRIDQSDADLLFESEIEEIEITSAAGETRTQRYFYPGPQDCLTCHNDSAGKILGVNTRQLNGELLYPQTGRLAHQLTTWQRADLFAPRNDWKSVTDYPRLAPLEDTSRSVEDRVRSYWDANCGMCHGVLSDIRADWDARFATPLAEQGVINGELQGSAQGIEDAAVVVPGDPDRSLLFLRDSDADPNRRMPPLGSRVPDDQYLALLEAWILSLSEQ